LAFLIIQFQSVKFAFLSVISGTKYSSEKRLERTVKKRIFEAAGILSTDMAKDEIQVGCAPSYKRE
jgi:hypothetical protein